MKLFELTVEDHQDEIFAISLVENTLKVAEALVVVFGDNTRKPLLSPVVL